MFYIAYLSDHKLKVSNTDACLTQKEDRKKGRLKRKNVFVNYLI